VAAAVGVRQRPALRSPGEAVDAGRLVDCRIGPVEEAFGELGDPLGPRPLVSLLAVAGGDLAVGVERPDRLVDVDQPLVAEFADQLVRSAVAVLEVVRAVVVATVVAAAGGRPPTDAAALLEDRYLDRLISEPVGDADARQSRAHDTELAVARCCWHGSPTTATG